MFMAVLFFLALSYIVPFSLPWGLWVVLFVAAAIADDSSNRR